MLQGNLTGNNSENKKYFDTSLRAVNLIEFGAEGAYSECLRK
jgi:hypothetical protein